jgi:O-methyltransferase
MASHSVSSDGADVTAEGLIKLVVTVLGARLPNTAVNKFASAADYLQTGRWMRTHGFNPGMRVNNRMQLIDAVAEHLANEEVLCLEFGVWKGESISRWSRRLRNAGSRLHGFDTFKGLPEPWCDGKKRGHFSTDGATPQLSDSRISFFKGPFEETLPKYHFVDSPVVVLFIDADLYSSAQFVLRELKHHIKVGTIICFDEFWDPSHEQLAFDDFLSKAGMSFELIAADYGMKHVAFRRTA